MKGPNWKERRLSPWQRRLLTGAATAIAGQLYLSLWAEGFRVSIAAVIYPLLLITLMRESHRPDTGAAAGLCVMALRVPLDLRKGMGLAQALVLEAPGGVFYLVYECLLCLLVRDRRSVSLGRLWGSLTLCDFGANLVNLALSSHLAALREPAELLGIAALALARASLAVGGVLLLQRYRALLLRREHEERYRRLFLLTAELKSELYFLKKNAEDIEAVMSNAYRLYEHLDEEDEEAKALALGVARDVHEVKKDNLRIIRGLEQVVTESYDQETMRLSDLLNILERSTRQLLGAQRADIRLECRLTGDLSLREHYQILSVLKNLVTNAVEAIQGAEGRGVVEVVCRPGAEVLELTVRDNGPGITERGMKNLFQVGYSTKFDPSTGNINRGVGLSAVQHIVQSLKGEICVDSKPGQGACFHITLPLGQVTGGEV